MEWFRRAPRRWRLVAALSAYLLGLVVGSLFVWPVNDNVLYFGIGLAGLFCVVRSFLVGTLILCIATSLIGFWWARTTSLNLTLAETASYEGRVQVVRANLSDPPKTRIQLKLLDSVHRGQLIEGTQYDWGIPTGSVVNVKVTIVPNRFRSAIGRNVLGQIEKLELGEIQTPPGPIYRFRQHLINRIGSALPEPHASLAVGLLTGVNSDFDSHFKEDLRRTGTAHIVAVSGANLTIVALFILRFAKRWGRWPAFGIAVVALASYAILSGFNPSVLRGLVMAILALFAATLGRITHRLPLILLTATVLSVLFPLGIVYSLSWQLSFLAFTGIIFLGPPLHTLFKRFGSVGPILAETLAAEIMVIPLILGAFGEISVVSPLVNGVILLLVPLAMVMSFGQAMAALIFIPLGRLVAWISYPILSLIIKPISLASNLPFAAYHVGERPVWLIAGLYVLVAIGAVWLLKRGHNELET